MLPRCTRAQLAPGMYRGPAGHCLRPAAAAPANDEATWTAAGRTSGRPSARPQPPPRTTRQPGRRRPDKPGWMIAGLAPERGRWAWRNALFRKRPQPPPSNDEATWTAAGRQAWLDDSGPRPRARKMGLARRPLPEAAAAAPRTTRQPGRRRADKPGWMIAGLAPERGRWAWRNALFRKRPQPPPRTTRQPGRRRADKPGWMIAGLAPERGRWAWRNALFRIRPQPPPSNDEATWTAAGRQAWLDDSGPRPRARKMGLAQRPLPETAAATPLERRGNLDGGGPTSLAG